MNTVSDGQRRRVQICMGLLKPFKAGPGARGPGPGAAPGTAPRPRALLCLTANRGISGTPSSHCCKPSATEGCFWKVGRSAKLPLPNVASLIYPL